MDTIHDIGGCEGFGPIRWQDDDDEKLFHEPWQARTWAICLLMFAKFRADRNGWTLDWHRHVVERIPPVEYLSMNYFEKWAQHMMATLVDDGVATVQEFVEGRSQVSAPGYAVVPLVASAEPGPARFAVGDAVLAKRSIDSMHCRLPGYVRGRKGVVHASLGPQILADASAVGDIRKEPLYTVSFAAEELWPEARGRRETVFLDLWESYLDAA